MGTFERILIATDGSEDATHAVHWGLNHAKNYNAKEIIALYVKDLANMYDMPEDDIMLLINSGLNKEGEKILGGVEKEAEELELKVECLIMEGHPADVILDVAHERNIDLIVMGTTGRSGITRLLMGSVAENVTRHAPCSVHVVRHKRESE